MSSSCGAETHLLFSGHLTIDASDTSARAAPGVHVGQPAPKAASKVSHEATETQRQRLSIPCSAEGQLRVHMPRTGCTEREGRAVVCRAAVPRAAGGGWGCWWHVHGERRCVMYGAAGNSQRNARYFTSLAVISRSFAGISSSFERISSSFAGISSSLQGFPVALPGFPRITENLHEYPGISRDLDVCFAPIGVRNSPTCRLLRTPFFCFFRFHPTSPSLWL